METFIKCVKKYKYPLSDKIFVLKKINYGANGKPISYLFKCGHWCTDTVFEDLINLSTGIQNYVGKQLTLF